MSCQQRFKVDVKHTPLSYRYAPSSVVVLFIYCGLCHRDSRLAREHTAITRPIVVLLVVLLYFPARLPSITLYFVRSTRCRKRTVVQATRYLRRRSNTRITATRYSRRVRIPLVILTGKRFMVDVLNTQTDSSATVCTDRQM